MLEQISSPVWDTADDGVLRRRRVDVFEVFKRESHTHAARETQTVELVGQLEVLRPPRVRVND